MADGPTPSGPRTPADPRINTLVKVVLRVGLSVALVLLVVGLVVELASGDHRGTPVRMLDLFAAHTAGQVILGLGVLVLALTPVAGVVTVVIGWIRERDRVFVGVGLVVVVVLAVAVVVGLAG